MDANVSTTRASSSGRSTLRIAKHERGFTLIELMVVIIIIGILSAIAIPAFLKQRQAAWDAETKTDLANYVTVAASYSADHSGLYGTATAKMTTAMLQAKPYSLTPSADDPIANFTLTVATNKQSYTISVHNKNFTPTTGHLYKFSSMTGLTTVS